MSGKYEIRNSYIIFDIKLNDIKIAIVESNDRWWTRYFNDHLIPEWKQDLMVDNREKILELTDKILKTEEADDDGEKFIMMRVRQSDITTDSGQASGNIITPTSIAGVEVIGKTQREIKSQFDPSFRWEFFDHGYDGVGWSVYRGETQIFWVGVIFDELSDGNGNYEREKIFSAGTTNPSYSTTDGFRIGSTSGDVLKKYPNTKIDEWLYSDHGIQQTIINSIAYYFDENCKVANQSSLIVNQNCRITSIRIFGYR